MRGRGVRTFLDTRKRGSEKIPGLGGGSENLQASKSTGGGGGLLTDRQTDMFLFGVLYKESTLTTISK